MQLTVQQIQCNIVRLPNRPPVMLARDLADIYETEPKRINEAVKRHQERFPEDFAFRLTDAEWEILRSQNVTANLKCQNGTNGGFNLKGTNLRSQIATSSYGGERYAPLAFTRNGANMLATVLKGPVAAARSVQIIRAFSAMEEASAAETEAMRQQLAECNKAIAAKDQRIDGLQTKLIDHLENHVKVEAKAAKLAEQKARLEKRQATARRRETVVRMEAEGYPRTEIARVTGYPFLDIRQIVLRARRNGRLPAINQPVQGELL